MSGRRIETERSSPVPEVLVRRIISGDGTESAHMRVRCTGCGKSMVLDDEIIREFLTARLPGGRPEINREDAVRMVRRLGRMRPARAQRGQEADLPRVSARTTLAELMVREVVCVRMDTSIESVRSLFLDCGISGVPVVDDEGNLVGIVSKTDLVREPLEPAATEPNDSLTLPSTDGTELTLGSGYHVEAIPRATVGEIMTPFVFVLPSSTSVAQAAALMAYEGVHRVVVVSGDGSVAGLVSALDVLGWLARESGYAVPRYTQLQHARKGSGPQ